LGRAHPPAHRDPGGMYGLGVAGNQWMPPIQVMPLGQQHIGAGWRKPLNLFEAFGRQADAVIDQVEPILVVAAAATVCAEQSATYISIKDLGGPFALLDLIEATATTTIAKAFPFQIGHLTQ